MNYQHPDELKRMQELIGYKTSMNEGKGQSCTPSRLEYKTKAANGKTYGIIYEGSKFYIKEAPAKDTEVVLEDFAYIGGENNKRENEYSSYPMASKQLDLKLISIREACAPRAHVDSPVKEAEWQVNETREMRSEIERFKQISENVSRIMEKKGQLPINEDFTMKHTLPEAPASNPSKEKVNSPYTETSVADGDKDFTKTDKNPAKAGAPFDGDGGDRKAAENGTKPSGNGKDTYSEDAKYVPENSVADKKPKGGKVTRADESKGRIIKLTEEQVLAWNKSKDYLDTSKGTEIGSSSPFTDELGKESNQTEAPTEKIHESDDTVGDKGEKAVHNTDSQNDPKPGTSEVGDSAPFDKKVNEDSVPASDAAGLPNDDDEYGDEVPDEVPDEELPFPDVAEGGAYLDFENDYNDWEREREENGLNDDDEFDFDDDDFDSVQNFVKNNDIRYKDEYADDDFNESRKRGGRRGVNEDKLNVWGKHPAYRKVPMTTPANTNNVKKGYKDWNDKSAEGEAPYGQKIGSSAPFDQVIDYLTDSIMKKLGQGFQSKSR